MSHLKSLSVIFFLGLLVWPTTTSFVGPDDPDWGFFAHRRINRLAALTLPPEMMVFFKPNIDWVSDHATDADMRRYATSWEAPRHYMDLDTFGVYPFPDLPRNWSSALQLYTTVWGVGPAGDTVQILDSKTNWRPDFQDKYTVFFREFILPRYNEGDPTINPDSLNAFLNQFGKKMDLRDAFMKEDLTEHGILPYNLYRMQTRLTWAFRQLDAKQILRLSADIGHYIGDAHVPLHTTSNYNGQKTNQHGIHGFWESRIPELFADEEYDFFVGKPSYIEEKQGYFWGIVLASHLLVDSVLTLERNLRVSFPDDRQMCPDMRNGRVVVAPCREFAAAYQDAMDGMVERRMRAAIQSVASVWYTAWVDAGQPDLSKMLPINQSEADAEAERLLKQSFESGKILGRPEEH
ncbi:MAG: zinc dependent phospholipase C family protein [Saprospiraceae bacterium]